MLRLEDTYLYKWNNGRLPKNLNIHASNSSIEDKTIIKFSNSNHRTYGVEVLNFMNTEPIITYDFIFSVAKKRVSEFQEIVNKLKSHKFKNSLNISDNTLWKEKEISLHESVISGIHEMDHNIQNVEYTKFTYNFKGEATTIIATTFILESAIKIFSKIWGYDEDGLEYRLLNFNIGDIVSTKKERDKDYMILDIIWSQNGDTFDEKYVISEMKKNGVTITYGNVEVKNVEELTWSRNNRIDDILN